MNFIIKGMTCAACSARVEKAVNKVDGVEECAVNLLSNSMTVSGTASSEEIIKAVVAAGYKASIDNGENTSGETAQGKIKLRLFSSVFLLVILVYFSMGQAMFNLPVPDIINNPLVIAIVQFCLSLLIILINRKFFVNGTKGIINLSPNMDTLVSLGAAASFLYSCFIVALMIADTLNGRIVSNDYLNNLYFESAGMILTFITVGKYLEEKAKGKTTGLIKSLSKLAPQKANIIKDGTEISVNINDVNAGDVLIVRSGESFATDGIIIGGECSADESALTGESIPIDKKAGDRVNCPTVCLSGSVNVKVTAVGKDSVLSSIIKMVNDASSSKAPVSRLADKISGIFVPCVLIISLLTFIVWSLADYSVGFSLARAVSVLVISCPCALGLATPVAITAASGVGAKYGILFKNAAILEITGKCKYVLFDKTGTITLGKPDVTDVYTFGAITKADLLSYAYSLENSSSHPLARAVCEYAKENGSKLINCENFNEKIGIGVEAVINGEKLFSSNIKTVSQNYIVPKNIFDLADELSRSGKTPLLFCKENDIIGLIALADTVKEDSSKAVSLLKKSGIKPFMITGDNEKTALAVAKNVGIEDFSANIFPLQKSDEVKKLQRDGGVIMVGDGINDAPALKTSNCGMAIGNGTDIAIEAADVVLMGNSLVQVDTAVRLSKRTLKTVRENLFWAFIYNIIGIPLAAGVLMPVLGIALSPMIAAAAMSLSSFCVVMNALRLNFFK